ncbi:hypothetical protein SH661x_001579 [Planctomicrobium sp. SH661]|uniref:hypothetical protein n=1 Tax=Planctomicrobium sp. SH661 TaxID=3448124 RepID=UPI003F5C55E9
MMRLNEGQIAAADVSTRRRCVVVWTLTLATVLNLLAATGMAADVEQVYVTPRGVTYTVTEKGLSTIRKGFGAVVDGHWTAFNAESRFKDVGDGQVNIPAPTEMQLTVVSPKEAKVRHVAGDVVCTYTYSFQNEDVRITARVENNHATSPINVIGFSGLTFHFARSPEGIMPVESEEFFQEHGLNVCHPSSFSPLGGGYAADKEVGFGLAPANSSLFRTLLLWDYADWNASERDRVLERKLHYFANSPIPAGGAVTVGLNLRVSPDMTWQHLLEPYREQFQKQFGPVQYKADGRWIATEDLSIPEKPVSTRRSDDPKGKEETRRVNAARRSDDSAPASSGLKNKEIGSSAGAQALCDSLIPRLNEFNGQGAILWNHGTVNGVDESGLCDFNLLPPEVEEEWERLADQFAAARLKLGVASRPSLLSIPVGNKKEVTIRLHAADPGHRELLWTRYDQMLQRGCKLFYLDQFGDSLDDVLLMQWLREKMGPNVQTFADHPSDVMLVYSGGYSGAVLKTGSAAGLERGYRLALGEKSWEILRWLVPGCELAGQVTEIKGTLADALETPERYFYSRQIVPLLPVVDFKRTAALKKLQPLFVAEDGVWQPKNASN